MLIMSILDLTNPKSLFLFKKVVWLMFVCVTMASYMYVLHMKPSRRFEDFIRAIAWSVGLGLAASAATIFSIAIMSTIMDWIG